MSNALPEVGEFWVHRKTGTKVEILEVHPTGSRPHVVMRLNKTAEPEAADWALFLEEFVRVAHEVMQEESPAVKMAFDHVTNEQAQRAFELKARIDMGGLGILKKIQLPASLGGTSDKPGLMQLTFDTGTQLYVTKEIFETCIFQLERE